MNEQALQFDLSLRLEFLIFEVADTSLPISLRGTSCLLPRGTPSLRIKA